MPQGSRSPKLLRKVPHLTIYFWIIKILTTAMGESTSDYMVRRYSPYLAVAIGFVILLLALGLQFTVKRYIAWVYWLAALAVSIAGTMGADVLHVGFGIPYMVSAAFYAVALGVIFGWWYYSEHTLSIHSVYAGRREWFYWTAVLAAFALGTATGDLAAYTLHLGFLTSGIVFAVLFALPGIAYWRFHINAILAFWIAYILTRPLGASFADWMGKAPAYGGLGFGDGTVSIVLAALIVFLVAFLSITGYDLPARDRPA